MALYLLLAKDDPSMSRKVYREGGAAIDDFVLGIEDLGGRVHTLAFTSGEYSIAGFVDLADGLTATAFALTYACFGRQISLVPAVAAQDWPLLANTARKVKVSSHE